MQDFSSHPQGTKPAEQAAKVAFNFTFNFNLNTDFNFNFNFSFN